MNELAIDVLHGRRDNNRSSHGPGGRKEKKKKKKTYFSSIMRTQQEWRGCPAGENESRASCCLRSPASSAACTADGARTYGRSQPAAWILPSIQVEGNSPM